MFDIFMFVGFGVLNLLKYLIPIALVGALSYYISFIVTSLILKNKKLKEKKFTKMYGERYKNFLNAREKRLTSERIARTVRQEKILSKKAKLAEKRKEENIL